MRRIRERFECLSSAAETPAKHRLRCIRRPRRLASDWHLPIVLTLVAGLHPLHLRLRIRVFGRFVLIYVHEPVGAYELAIPPFVDSADESPRLFAAAIAVKAIAADWVPLERSNVGDDPLAGRRGSRLKLRDCVDAGTAYFRVVEP